MSSNESTERRSPFSRSPFNKGPAGESPAPARSVTPSAPPPSRPSGGRPPSPPRASKAAEASTMNRPDSTSLNANANATVAAQAYEKSMKASNYNPAIANGFIPPVLEKKEETKTESPFKAAPKEPIKRPKGVTNAALKEEAEEEAPKSEPGNSGPRIAQFIPIPVVEAPKSPFAPVDKTKTENGLKAPIKRPPSASVNHAEAKRQEQELNRIRDELEAMGGVTAKPKEEEPAQEPVKPASDRPWDKTFVPLAPVPFFAEDPNENKSPFAAPVQKTEEQIKREEAAAQRALEESRTVGQKKSKLDRLMEELNKPIF